MVTNVSYLLLDAAVIAGRGEEPALGTMTHARLLEEVAALGGVLRHLGVTPGVPVVVDLDDDADAVVAALAVSRLGGVVTTVDDADAPAALVSTGSAVTGAGRVRVVRGEGVSEPDLDWRVMIRAGRTDPAACEVLEPAAAYSPARSVAEQLEVLAELRPPYAQGELRRALAV